MRRSGSNPRDRRLAFSSEATQRFHRSQSTLGRSESLLISSTSCFRGAAWSAAPSLRPCALPVRSRSVGSPTPAATAAERRRPGRSTVAANVPGGGSRSPQPGCGRVRRGGEALRSRLEGARPPNACRACRRTGERGRAPTTGLHAHVCPGGRGPVAVAGTQPSATSCRRARHPLGASRRLAAHAGAGRAAAAWPTAQRTAPQRPRCVQGYRGLVSGRRAR